jgi:cell division GTPase FtsZ
MVEELLVNGALAPCQVRAERVPMRIKVIGVGGGGGNYSLYL